MPNESIYGIPTLQTYDTLQHLDEKSKLRFNQLWQAKEIVGTNPKTPFCNRVQIDDPSDAIRTRPRLCMLGICLDNATDSRMREKIVRYTYTTTAGQAASEVWNVPDCTKVKEEKCQTVLEERANPFSFRSTPLKALPKEIRLSAKKWDAKQKRLLLKESPRETFFADKDLKTFDKRGEYLKAADEPELRSLRRKNELRLPYVKLPESYGGFRPQIGHGVPLLKKEFSIYSTHTPVSEAITKRLEYDSRKNDELTREMIN